MAGQSNLYERFAAAVQDGVIKRRIATMEHTAGQLASFQTQTSIMWLQEMLGRLDVLEIGTYFGNTSYRVAETASRVGGSLVTIDPYGGERMPGIIAAWPKAWQDLTQFYPVNSMTYFMKLKDENTPRAADAPFDIAFIDGDHSFDNKFYDIQQASSYLKPGGVIFVGAINQYGTEDAVRLFLDRHRLWRALEMGRLPLEAVEGGNTAMLFAPNGIELCSQTYKLEFRGVEITNIKSARFALSPTSAEGTVRAMFNLNFVTHDNHIKGDGLISSISHTDTAVMAGARTLEIVLAKPVSVNPPPGRPGNFSLEIELTFLPKERTASSEASSLLLDVSQDLEIF